MFLYSGDYKLEHVQVRKLDKGIGVQSSFESIHSISTSNSIKFISGTKLHRECSVLFVLGAISFLAFPPLLAYLFISSPGERGNKSYHA